MKPLSIFVSTLLLALSALSAADRPPNIVFFFTDDQTSSTIGCYGNDIVQTPVLDGLAARGTRFENAFVSHSICWVSRTTILSGLTGRSFGTSSNPDQARPDAVAELYSDILRANGYRTGYYGKWHAKMPKGFKKEDHFDEFEQIGRNPFFKKQPDGSYRHETELIVDRGIEFIKNQPKGKPFFVNMNFNACHAEDGDRRPGPHFAWPKAVNGMYDDVDIPRPHLDDPATFEALPGFFKTTINRERYFWRWNTPTKYDINIRAYYRMVSGIDGAIGRFIEALEKEGLAENTIILYSADNGYHMANRGLAGKWSHFEESLRVPLIVMDPRVSKKARGRVSEAIALNLDFPATFLDWAGANVPKRYQGRSLASLVDGKTPKDWRTESYHEHFAVRNRIPAFEGLRNADFKYVRYIDEDNHEFLHDLRNDPDELVNLAGSPEHAAVLKEMRERTDARVAELGGPLDPMNGPLAVSTQPHPVASAANATKGADDDGFASLFDGKSLRGWVGDPQYWSVKEGAITGVTDGSLEMNRFITWKGSTIQNFDLRMKVKVSPGGNSGIQYRGLCRPDIDLDIVTGYQCDIVADRPQYNGMLYEEKGRRILSHTGEKVVVDENARPWIVGKLPFKEFAPGEWHEYRVLVRGNHHKHWIDGHPTADLVDLDEEGRSLDGVLAMQVHVGPAMTIQFKDIRIKHLPDDLPLRTAADTEIPAGSKGVRPQGKLPKDWKAPVYGERE